MGTLLVLANTHNPANVRAALERSPPVTGGPSVPGIS